MSTCSPREELLELLAVRSACRGSFILASGATSDFYVDAKLTTLDPRGAALVGAAGWQLINDTCSARGCAIDAVGGLTMGADPIALSIGIMAGLEDPAHAPRVFNVRKTPKGHGRGKSIEGNFNAGDRVAVIDDVITTGASTIQAIDAVEREGGRVEFVVALVDRDEGGRDNIRSRGFDTVALFHRKDILAVRDRLGLD